MKKHRATGGVNAAEEDLRENPARRNADAEPIYGAAEEKKRGGAVHHGRDGKKHEGSKGECRKCGGRAGHKRGGKVGFGPEDEATHLKRGGRARKEVEMHGESRHHAGRKPRKSGGRTGSDQSPFSSARHGSSPREHEVETEME